MRSSRTRNRVVVSSALDADRLELGRQALVLRLQRVDLLVTSRAPVVSPDQRAAELLLPAGERRSLAGAASRSSAFSWPDRADVVEASRSPGASSATALMTN